MARIGIWGCGSRQLTYQIKNNYRKRRYFQVYQLSIYKLTRGFNLVKKSMHNTKYTWSTFARV